MKKLKSIMTLGLVFGILSSATFFSCGGKKEGTEDTTEQTEDADHSTHGDTTKKASNPDEGPVITH